MAVEGDGHGEAYVLPGVLDRLPDDLLMSQVHAIEHADGHAGLARAGLQLACRADDVHGSGAGCVLCLMISPLRRAQLRFLERGIHSASPPDGPVTPNRLLHSAGSRREADCPSSAVLRRVESPRAVRV